MMFIGLFIFFLTLTTINAQCSDRRAICVDIHRCASVISLLQRESPVSAETLQTVRSLKCGIQNNSPMVCCLNEMTPRTDQEPFSPPNASNHPNLRLLDPGCGPVTQAKVFRGNKTGIFEFPWMALIAYDTGKTNPEFHCGGTIISSRYVLTAAHCVTSLPSGFRLIGVRVGDYDTSKERDCDIDVNGLEIECAQRYQEFGVESVHYHPDFSAQLRNDIALIRLNSSIDFTALNVKSICLPYGSAANISQRRAIVTGWGYGIENGPYSSELQQTKLSLVPTEHCKEVYKQQSREIWHKQLCAGGVNNFDSILRASDSGGPLQAPGIYNGKAVRSIQYGIVSVKPHQYGTESYPGVFTNVAYYMDWILNTMTD